MSIQSGKLQRNLIYISLHCRDICRNLRKGTFAKIENRKHRTLLALVTSGRVVFSRQNKNHSSSSQIMFGLTTNEVRKLTFECGVSFGVYVPDSWKSTNCAGPDLFTVFMRHNPELSIR
ncbi:hypothetical protein PR048_015285 [Dryococelus australis]|uniref:Uncharacterized protein n=1 Tax=Dryococelus australis TaxID=614101 RepID=A0ABQ9HGI9_9NEOP|nr:hypothetical protein PR048_015285 [Dryococelus australis]